MLLRRVIEHLRDQNWVAVAIDFVIVVIGVVIGLQVSNWNEQRQNERRMERVVQAIIEDMEDAGRVEQGFSRAIAAGIAAFEKASNEGLKPPPFVYRIPGSDTAPSNTWRILQSAGLVEIFDPGLLFDLSYFLSEREGIGTKVVRYMEFVEAEILPYQDDPDYFYDWAGRMKPEYRANMQRLMDWNSYTDSLLAWSTCLKRRLEAPRQPGPSCRPNFDQN